MVDVCALFEGRYSPHPACLASHPIEGVVIHNGQRPVSCRRSLKRRRLTRFCLSVSLVLLGASNSLAASVSQAVEAAVVGGKPIWVFLKDKGDSTGPSWLSPGEGVSSRAVARIARRGETYDPRLDQPIADRYRQILSSMGLTIRTESRWFNAVSGTLPADRLHDLAALAFVDSLQPVVIYQRPVDRPSGIRTLESSPGMAKPALLDYGNSRAQIEAIEVDSLHAHALDGRGVRIGFLDTGFSLGIGVFDSLQVVATRDFINRDTDVGDGDTAQMDHGTSTLSVCGGFQPGQLIGVAPRAEYVLAKTEILDQEIRIEEDYWVEGLWWVDSIGCDIVSSSLGYINWYSPSDLDGNTALATQAADLAVQRGVIVVTAAGNRGRAGLIAPGDGDSVLTVGASDLTGYPASFSSRGPTADGRIKPDIVAPGVRVWSALPANATFANRDGTSFATPLVAGVCALLLQNLPSLRPAQLIDLLRHTASRAENPNNDVGWGLVRAAHAAGMQDIVIAPEIEARPNPTPDSVWIVTQDTTTNQLSRYDVFTVAGEPVYSGEFRGSPGLWPGSNQAGQSVASGVYLLWVRTPRGEAKLKVALVRRK